jgi:glyoxylase-like metal-dependent hydrolase (beta-lactamase superfamily II)
VRIHHLNCATLCPPFALLTNGEGSLFARGAMSCHCLLIETDEGLVLVDTGLGLGDVERPERLGKPFHFVAHPRLSREQTALHQIEALGHRAADVRHIVLTHLDLDHAGGLGDFPQAQVHLSADEKGAALSPRTTLERHRYVAAQWAHGPKWVEHRPEGERWMGFESVRALPAGAGEVLLVPLPGHTRGHCGVAVRTGAGWLLHCGDAYFYRGEVDQGSCPLGLRIFQTLMEVDRSARLQNQGRLRELARTRRGEVAVFCAHDPVELQRAQAAQQSPQQAA